MSLTVCDIDFPKEATMAMRGEEEGTCQSLEPAFMPAYGQAPKTPNCSKKNRRGSQGLPSKGPARKGESGNP